MAYRPVLLWMPLCVPWQNISPLASEYLSQQGPAPCARKKAFGSGFPGSTNKGTHPLPPLAFQIPVVWQQEKQHHRLQGEGLQNVHNKPPPT